MDFESILKLVKEYLTSINVRQETINNKISKNNIKSLYFKPLSPADIFKKKAVKGHTTHIAITGASRELFYDEKILNNQKYTSEHHLHNIILFQKNYQIITNKKIYDNEIELINEISSSHIRCIKNQKSQVAFGLKSFSSANFIELREHLYEDDKLIILRDYNDDYYVLAIKKEVQTPLNNLNGIYFFKNSTINLSSSFYVKEKKASYNIPNKLQKTTSELIAQLNKKI
ncbi:hypothetical protein [Longibaculum muris]|uniref:hypothetical protein n=1 Tax=Longibaculum muris TaxID=1796628 RepID=UPI003AB89845